MSKRIDPVEAIMNWADERTTGEIEIVRNMLKAKARSNEKRRVAAEKADDAREAKRIQERLLIPGVPAPKPPDMPF